MIRLNKYLSMAGVCSRRKADELIESGAVEVNGIKVDSLGYQIDEEKDLVSVYGKRVKKEEKMIYLMLNKPSGYITTNDEQFSRPSTLDLIHEQIRVFPIGRLDMPTEGMLLLTNDGEFANKLMHPKNKIDKEYVVKIKGDASLEQVRKLQQGVDIGDYITKPAEVEIIGKNRIQIVIKEGKNRQIRRMCQAAGIEVLTLKRTRIGKLTLGNLPLGEYRLLKKEEVEKIFE